MITLSFDGSLQDLHSYVGFHLDGTWVKVSGDGRAKEGYIWFDPDGSLIVTDDNNESAIFDRNLEDLDVEVP